MPHFDVHSQREPGRLMVVPTGDMDIAAVEAVRAAMDERGPDEALVLDLSRLDFLDTSGLQLVVETHRRARDAGFSFEVRRAKPAVQRVFEISGLDSVLPFAEPGADG